MIPGRCDYHAPESLPEALSMLSQFGEEAKVLAGGHSLIPMMKMRFAEPAHLIDLNRIDDLRGVREADGTIYIGAMTRENDLIVSEILRDQCPLLPEAARNIADPQVRNCGTIGGDIAHGDPANDHPALMLALEASFVLTGPNGERIVPADEFFLGTYWTALEAEEILTEIRIPAFEPHTGYAYWKLKRKQGDWATAGAVVVLQLEQGRCKRAGIGLTNAGPTALKVTAAEELLTGQIIDDALIDRAVEQAKAICEPAEDLRGDVEYKTQMTGEMTRRAIRQALERAKES
jgi:aerobic carbon-monoxide dehydrogenase medium subunit